MRTAAYNDDVASGLRSISVVAKRASQALSNAAGARMCQGTFFVLATRKMRCYNNFLIFYKKELFIDFFAIIKR